MRALKIIGRILLGLIGFVIVLAIVVVLGINTPYGHHLLEQAAKLGGAEITGLDGHIPDDLTAQRITVADAKGVWLEIDDLQLDWSPLQLLHKQIQGHLLSASRVHVDRYPTSTSSTPPSSSSSSSFDYRVAVDHVKIDRIELPEATLSLDGSAVYQAGVDPAVVDVRIAAATPDAAGQGPASLNGTLAGPLDKAALDVDIKGKGLTTHAEGMLDLVHLGADLKLAIDHPAYANVAATAFNATVKGNADAATIHADLAGLKLPGSQPDLLGDGPLTLDATYKKGASPDITATLAAGASAADGLKIAADAQLTLASMAGALNLHVDRLAVSGAGATHIDVSANGDAKAAELHSVITGLTAPGVTPAMLGDTPLKLDVQYRQGGTPEIAAQLQGDTVSLTTSGALPTSALALDYHLVLPKLAAFAQGVAGNADLAGRLDGPFDSFAVKAKAQANVTTSGVASTINGDINATGLPGTPAGAVSVKGAYGGQPVSLDATAAIGPDHLTHIDITDATWQAIQAKGGFILATDGGLPTGNLVITAKRLPPPAQSGNARATIDLTRQGAIPLLKVMVEVGSVTVQGTTLARSVLTGTVTDPIGLTPVLTANLIMDGVRSGAYAQNLRLDVTGPENALAIKLAVAGTASLNANATLDVKQSLLRIASLQGTAQGQTLRLSAPTTLTYAPQITLGATHITLGGSTLDLAGRLAPTLDVTAALHAIPAELAKLVDPTITAEGRLNAQARIQGTPERPTGTIRVNGTGLRVRQPPGIPVIRLDAQANLENGRAMLDATIAASSSQLHVSGGIPIAPGGAYDVTARGNLNLSMLDPFLTGAGALTRGQLALDATLTGTVPTPSGTITLHNGSVTVPAQGARLSDIEALVRAQPNGIVLESLTAKAGKGTLEGHGTIGLAAPMPVDIKLTARRASPLSSDLITTVLDADLSLSGAMQTAMDATGTIHLGRTEINIPQRLPASLPVLNVRQQGARPPKPAPPPVPINLNIAVTAPGLIFVRGRGLDAELGGTLHIGGTTGNPQPEGGFSLRRGTFSLAGQTLNFTTGRVEFDGNIPVDPRLNFVATSQSSSVTATITVTGTASAPHIALSSIPELPQDEVLAQLLFHRSAAELGPLQLAEITAALAQIADVGGSGGIDPLGSLRKGLGLDVLSVGSSPGSSPSVEAGRNIFKGVYLGAKQSTSGSGSQATVRVDLAKGLRLEADLGVAPAQASTPTPGAPPTGNQVGITYEFDY